MYKDLENLLFSSEPRFPLCGMGIIIPIQSIVWVCCEDQEVEVHSEPDSTIQTVAINSVLLLLLTS